MEAKWKRGVRSGSEYDHLIPRTSGNDVTIKKEADVKDTIAFIQKNTPKVTWQTAKLAKALKGKTLKETCSNIWHFVYEHIPYKRDEEGVEQVRSPRRAWRDRKVKDKEGKVGVDCDCYTVFISSVLMNLGIPHKYRITKYAKDKPEEERWQHIYVVVPINGKLNRDLENQNDYITMDCVKDEYDDEEPYLDREDYNAMKLDYLDGLDGDEGREYRIPNSIDAQDMASVYDEEDLGKLGQWLKKAVKTVAKPIGTALRTVNRFANPATILLRNGFLLGMKINLMGVAGKLRYGYLNDDQARKMGMNLAELAKVRKIKDKAEDVYYGAGGKKENLKKGILEGKGNKNRQVPLSGLSGIEDYADVEEYNILHYGNAKGVDGLGEVASGAALTAATSAISAIALALKQVKNLFPKGSPQESEFQSDAGAAASASEIESSYQETIQQEPTAETKVAMPTATDVTTTTSAAPATTNNTSTTTADASSGEASPENDGFFKKSITWVKENPGKSALIGVLIAGTLYVGYKAVKGNKKKGGEVNGLPKRWKTYSKKKKSKGVKKKSTGKRKRIQAVKIS